MRFSSEESAAYRPCIELQVREYIACLTGEVEVYRPMTWKL
ncbi:hypothetical protein [Nostoc sp. KVJ3]|nr:hypothetical protein [Nostoc sp. KVJ3]